MKNILVTGGTGYIGSHGVVALIEFGYTLIIVDNLSNSSKEVLENIQKITGIKPDFYEVNLRYYESLESVFQKYDFEAVIHFAGEKAVGESCEMLFYYYENNVLLSINLFKLMEQYDYKKIIFSLSPTVYDSIKFSPFVETDSTGNTTNPYGTMRIFDEKYFKRFSYS